MSIGSPYIQSAELGLPLIRPRKIFVGRGKGGDDKKTDDDDLGDINRLIAHILISTIIFLVIIIWFTLVLNAATQTQTDSDYFLLQFAVYFSIVGIFAVVFIILLLIT